MDRKGIPLHCPVFDQLGEDQARVDHGLHDFTNAVIPFRRPPVRHCRGVAVGISADGVIKVRLDRLEIRVLDDQQVVIAVLVDGVEHGMPFSDVQATTRPQQCSDDLRPTANVGEPVKGASTGVNKVELFSAQHISSLIQLSMHESHRVAGRRGEASTHFERGRREVVPRRCPSPEPGQRNGVRTNVALEMYDIFAVQATQVRSIATDDTAEQQGVVDVGLQVV